MPEPVGWSISRTVEMWDRLFIEDDSVYVRGMLLKENLGAGQSTAVLLAADFASDPGAFIELGCAVTDPQGQCCEQIVDEVCQHPAAALLDAAHPGPVPVQIQSVQCIQLDHSIRLDRECTAELLDTSGNPLNLGYGLTTTQAAGLVAGGALSLQPAARALIETNLRLVFIEPVFLSDYSDAGAGPMPKVPKECVDQDNALSNEYRWKRARPYFYNNQGSGVWAGIDNVVHLITETDYDGGCEPPIPARLGRSSHSVNISDVYKERIDGRTDLPEIFRNSIWAHELIHQFAVNHCHVQDHCNEIGPTIIPGEIDRCLMTVDGVDLHGPYLGVSCAAPNIPSNRSVCADPNPPHVENYLRFHNFLNEEP